LNIVVLPGSKTVEECDELDKGDVILVGIRFVIKDPDRGTKAVRKHCAYNHVDLWTYLNRKRVTKKGANGDRGRCCVVYLKTPAASSQYVFIINAAVSG
jgi:hypothetical protein